MASSIFGTRAAQPQSPMQPVPQQSNPPSNNGLLEGLQQLKDLMGMVNSGGKTGQMAELALKRHPAYPQVEQTIQQYGGDARAAFYAEAQRRGIDPNQILELLR